MLSYGAEPPAGPAHILRTAFAFVASQALYVAAEIGIADQLADDARGVDDLAHSCRVNAEALLRLLQMLAALRIVKREHDDRFALTPSGEFLRTGVTGSMRSMVRFLAGPWAWRAFEQLGYSVRTGEPAFDRVWGVSNFDYWARNPDVSKIHDEAMAGLTAMEAARVLTGYDFSSFRTLVDVGGGNGAFLAAILRQLPSARGIVAELPHVVGLASSEFGQSGVADRCELADCDFFEAVPPGGDLYILKHIIHDWDDERARIVLKNCCRAMHAESRLLIVDCVLPEHPMHEDTLGYFVDMTMLAITPGGRERTRQAFTQLLESAGLVLVRIIPTGGISDVIEARKLPLRSG
jgi:hypothetical protein